MRKKIIDVSDEEKKKEVFEKFNSLNSKNQAHEFFGISDNKEGSKYLAEVANLVGFDLNSYKERKRKEPKYCKQCGKEIVSKWANEFCCSSCSATFNNKVRDESIYKKISDKLKKDEKEKQKKIKIKKSKSKSKRVKKELDAKMCPNCGEWFNPSTKDTIYCSSICASKYHHKKLYKDFIENNDKYCRGDYTPKTFKNDFLEEQGGLCSICGCETTHNGKPLVFILDHIDGNSANNKRENLRLVCPNCDSQLETFKSKNKNSARRKYWRKMLLNKIKEEEKL